MAMSISKNNNNKGITYECLWKMIIRPNREIYSDKNLLEKNFEFNGKKYTRTAYDLINMRGLKLKCNYISPEINYRTKDKMPIVIYLHGNASSQLEAMEISTYLLKNDINLFCFDFSGSGLSEGKYISLGYYEKDDLKIVMDFVSQLPGVGKIGIWGRSMGASTALLYSWMDKRISCIVVDSPFSELKLLAQQICQSYQNIPTFIINIGLFFIKNTIKEKINADLEEIKPIEYANKTNIPCFFIHAKEDKLIPLKHSLDIFEVYKGLKFLNIVEGNHNTKRKSHHIIKIMNFFNKFLN